MRGLIAITLSLAVGCDWYLGGEEDPPPQVPDASPVDAAVADVPSSCLDQSERTQDCRVDLSLDIVDFTTRTPNDSATMVVEVTTAWDAIPPFPLGCPALASFDVPVTGIVDATDVTCDSPLHPPILLLLVDDAPESANDRVAPTAFDRRLVCADAPASDCGIFADTLPVLASSVERDWRMQMLDDGMTEADTRGLVIMQFNEDDGTPAAGVAPTIFDVGGERYLAPGTEVRFIAGDRISLVRADAAMTGISGLAIIAIPAEIANIGARRDDRVWDGTGVFTAEGWIFYEDLRPAP